MVLGPDVLGGKRMARFSIESALKSGFRLARREWKAVLVWGAAYVVFTLLVQVISIGGALPEYLRQVGQDPEAAAAALEGASEAQAFVTAPIIMILGLLGMAVGYGAIARAILRPDDRRFFYIRFGRSELWLLLTILALAVLAIVAILPMVIVVSALAALVGAGGAAGVLLAILLGAALGAAWLYVAARLSVAWVQAFDEQRFVLADAWRLTRGHGWRIVLTALALVFLLIIMYVAALIPLGIGFAVVAAVGGQFGVGLALVLAPVALVVLAGFSGLSYAVMVAPYVEVYRELNGAALPGGETAEVFA